MSSPIGEQRRLKKGNRMLLTADQLVLLILDAAGGSVRGKTLLQKRAYFLAQLLHLDLSYRAHYYGPYSPEIESALSQNKGLGFVVEATSGFGMEDAIGFEVRRYDYRLTDDGRKVVAYLKEAYPKESAGVAVCLTRLVDAGDDSNYVSLSIAAKVHHILSEGQVSMTPDEIQGAAQQLGWKIMPHAINLAAMFLDKLGLVIAPK